MPPSMRVEVYNKERQQWTLAGEVKLGDPDGSISSNTTEGRDVYIFGVDPIENQGYIKRSVFGDDELDSQKRSISSVGFIAVATLHDSESHEMTVLTDKSTKPRHIRFTYLSG